jgi:PAS domain S-box-containing protein
VVALTTAPTSIPTAYDPILVSLSILIAVLASYTALDLAGRIRTATGWQGWAWIGAASVAMGGGIWSMHFIAMLAFQMTLPVVYDFALTLLSLLLAVGATAAGFAFVGRKGARRTDVVLSGTFVGLGIVGMHYTGMAAMHMPADLQYDGFLVVLSVVIAIGAATVALWLAVQQQNLRWKLVAAVAMGLAIAGMHYTGMAAASFTATAGSNHVHDYPALDPTHLALAIGGATVLLLCLALAASFYDRQFIYLAGREVAAVRRAEQRLRILLQGVTDHAIYLLDPRGNVGSWNTGAQRIKGYAADEIIGQHLSRFYTQEDVDAGAPGRALETALRDGRYESEGWRVRKDGSRFWASAVIDCIRDDDGELLGFAKVARDTTDRREAQRILDQAQEQLFQAQKTEAIGQLTGGVAHDFNNLLTVTLGNLEMARRYLQDGAPGDAFLHVARAEQSSLRAAALTDRLLAFSRQQTLQPEPIDPNKLVAGMSSIVRPAVGENIAVQTALAADLWPINVDPNRLESALLNLVINARDAMAEGGRLTIETANVHLDAVYAARHDEVVEGRYVLIAVTDTGTGMASDVAARACEPFYTTKGIGEGSGLGLSQVFGFVKQSGGHLKIYSEVGHGTSVKIYLPRFVGEALPSQPVLSDAAAALPRAPHEETILIVEDEPEVRAYSHDVLTQLGYRVIEAEDAMSGLAALEANPDVMLLFTDVGLPGMNGRDLALEALRRRPDLRVLYTTGYASKSVFNNGTLDRAAHLVAKPFSMATLATKVHESIATAR